MSDWKTELRHHDDILGRIGISWPTMSKWIMRYNLFVFPVRHGRKLMYTGLQVEQLYAMLARLEKIPAKPWWKFPGTEDEYHALHADIASRRINTGVDLPAEIIEPRVYERVSWINMEQPPKPT